MRTNYRRLVFATLVFATMAGLLAAMIWTFLPKGISAAELVLVICFMITLPWTVIGFWNAFIGFGLMRLTKDPGQHVFPDSANLDNTAAIDSSTAIAMCIRNEDPNQIYRNLNAMIARLVASGQSDRFHLYILSDSYSPEIIAHEEICAKRLEQNWFGRFRITYRRRADNPGFKAGNIRDFCERWGDQHDFLLTLDADSVMSASAILRMVRLMQANEKLGIVQSLVVGLPSVSAFTRVFQFGMRMGMRSYTLGSAWWQADCGPYWGHNALLRLKPFIEHCELPKLPGNGPLSGWILSHDQVEATYMRRAGYECRVLIDQDGSYEENPPHLLEFIRRDLRWCHGNMQYFQLLNEAELHLTSRIQLVLAILMFIGSPAWMLFVVVATIGFLFPGAGIEIRSGSFGYLLYGIIMTMIFAPKIVTVVDTLIDGQARDRFGGGFRIVFSFVLEIVFSMLLAPIMAVANTVFLAVLFAGKAKGWLPQQRQAQSLPFSAAARHLVPQTLFGLSGFLLVVSSVEMNVVTLLICLPVFIGPMLAIPFGMATSLPIVGISATRGGIGELPEENTTPVILRALDLPAVNIIAKRDKAVDRLGPLTVQQLLDMDIELDNITGESVKPVRVVA